LTCCFFLQKYCCFINPEASYTDILNCLQSTSSNGYDGKVNAYDAIQCLPDPPCQGLCGDANSDGAVNIGDAVWIINYVIVTGSPAPMPIVACGDANTDAGVNISDAVWLINWVFTGGPAPCN